MKRGIYFLVILCIFLLLVFTGCSPAVTTGQKQQGDLMADVKAASWSQITAAPNQDYVDSVNYFAACLLDESIKNDGNVMISPASVMLALSMTLNGAAGETRAAMLEVLANRGLDVAKVNEGSRNWAASLSRTGEKTILSIANSIWFRQDFQPDQTFLQTNADFFKAGARALDFGDEASLGIINGWVDEATRGTIKKIIDKISPNTVMFLINSIYFKSDWQVPFLQAETYRQTFNTPDGPVETEFMHRTDKIAYFSGDDATGMVLPYDDGQFVFFALLPENDVSPRDWLGKQDPDKLFQNIANLMAQKSNFTVELSMPKFEAGYEDTLNDELKILGMGIAFDGAADFSLLNAQHVKGLYISEVRHKTYIRVDEKGTEAAAVTSVAIDESMVSSDVQVTLDRPFIYGIMDNATGIPLFVGILEDPSVKE